MSYYVISQIPNAEFKFKLEKSELEDIDAFEESLSEWFFDLAQEALLTYQIKPIGVFSEDDITQSFIQQAYAYIFSKKKDWFITINEVDGANNIINSKIIDATHIVNQIIDKESENGDFYAQVGKYVKDCIHEYCKISRWHVEEDKMWFAPCGSVPQKPWIIDSSTDEYELEFWFSQDCCNLMEYIGDFNESFLTWYHFECGFCPPDMDKIMESCPIPC